MTRQLNAWKSEFGRAYTDRNPLDWRTRLPAFQQMLGGLPIKRVLEVGCNRGHNLLTLAALLGEDCEIIGIEPNRYALELGRATSPKVALLNGHVFDIPFKDGYFDLVFTSGVLIHVPLADLPQALIELHRVTRRYILAIEYAADEETVIQYHGHNDLLWKRNFLKHFQTQLPGLILVNSGFWPPDHGFDRCNWWLFEKPIGPDKK